MRVDLEKELNEVIEEKNVDARPLKFGKYVGEAPYWVADNDPRYLVWFYENVDEAENHMSEGLYELCLSAINN